ncbi:MAG: 1-deoxy-D-xylulose-5-phosphate reductoisomerase [Dysgonamonadaceae bacterium]|nr:1-deoxy-D-xylulose-5-phosphate reductoisomerase [Dysgonamonadaceae bacterium]MDD4728630.1 1-deoxy-D-xylulose-5-phosphate reductoisomerase [Dysgonamonadaceae bacterium]
MEKKKKQIAILGSTGSIGTQALDVISQHPDRFEVYALTANNNIDLLVEQAIKFSPEVVVIANEQKYLTLKDALKKYPIKIWSGLEAISDVVESDHIDVVLAAIVGFSGLKSTISALKARKVVALANKETLVVAGEYIIDLALKNGAPIIPVDSEHSAIFQCLNGEELNRINRIWLTASGGPFRNFSREELASVSKEQALNHPKWCMGSKVTIDSSTLMNKGFEMIEAKWLFDVNPSQIEIVIHPQSIVHSMVEFSDTSVISQMGVPDMRVPIQYAFTYPKRVKSDFKSVDFFQLSNLTFEKPDLNVFKNLTYAYESIEKGGNMPCILNAANEIAVEAFLNDKISYLAMFDILEQTMQNATFVVSPSLDDYFESDFEARKIAVELISKL